MIKVFRNNQERVKNITSGGREDQRIATVMPSKMMSQIMISPEKNNCLPRYTKRMSSGRT